MKSKLHILLVPCLLLTVLLASSVSHVSAIDIFSNCETVNGQRFCGPCRTNPDSPVCREIAQQPADENPVAQTINKAANIIASVAGVTAIIMIIIAGFTMTIASSDTERVSKSRRRITYSLVGVIVVALAWAITRFITDRVIQ